MRENVTPQSTAETPFLLVDITIQPTNPDEFVMASGGYQLVEFFAFWCPTCKSMTPVLRKLESKYAGKIRFTYLDIDDPKTNPIKQALGYQFQPHLFLVDPEGNVIKQWIGYVAEEELDAVLGSLP
ncbi:MAG: thioredoxin domain-containing protein [Anaerolineales bacterium]|nr:thioredoxin domain-containing protein [Anaerolineales bacterium]MDW8160871.1 thioredoxin domain-containing protein [Anaerolineales bacterium]